MVTPQRDGRLGTDKALNPGLAPLEFVPLSPSLGEELSSSHAFVLRANSGL